MTVRRKRIAYGKLGRVIDMDPKKWGECGGDNEAPYLLEQLANRHPDVDWIVIARNKGWVPPLSNIVNPWEAWAPYTRKFGNELYRQQDQSIPTYHKTVKFFDDLTMDIYHDLDGIVMWGGQHGTSNSPIPKVTDRSVNTKAQVSQVHYSGHVIRGINEWRGVDPVNREEVWLLPDVRNYVKARDLAWPRQHPVLCQYDWTRTQSCERYGDTRSPSEVGFADGVAKQSDGLWISADRYVGSGLELVGIPRSFGEEEPAGWEDRDHDFGILINEARNYGMRPELTRLHAMEHYARPIGPSWIHGTWSADSLAKLGRDIQPIPYGQIFNLMQTTKCTFTTPSSGSGWATAKPWESFATGIICFFHPLYDTQNHILFPDGIVSTSDELKALHKWLRVKDPADLARKVKAVTTSRSTYDWLAKTQYKHFKRELERQRCVTTIEMRLGL